MFRELSIAVGAGHDIYMGIGGCGDALLLLAVTCTNPNAKILFFANPGSKDLIADFFNLFGVNYQIFDKPDNPLLMKTIYKIVVESPSFRPSAHLPDVPEDCMDWYYSLPKYMSRIVTSTDWKERFGVSETKNVILSPHGSTRDLERQRFLTPIEYRNILAAFPEDIVYSLGNEEQLEFYGGIKQNNHFWLTNNQLFGENSKKDINLRKVLQIINSAKLVLSVDSWVKTYALLAGIPTSVIQNRSKGKYIPVGEDPSDLIFLNIKIWKDLKMVQI